MVQTTSPAAFDGAAFAASLPTSPGVYRMYDAQGILLYVGKAVDLRRRVSQYFQGIPEHPRTKAMVAQVSRMEVTVVPTETDALVLESRLIVQDQPRYNVALRHGQGYPWLHLGLSKSFPDLKAAAFKGTPAHEFFGPFPSRKSMALAQETLQKHFQLRTCSDSFFAHRSRPCLEHQMSRCCAPCVGLVSQEDYAQRVQQLVDTLSGKSAKVVVQLGERMAQASAQLNFEQAAQWRDRLMAVRTVQTMLAVEQGQGAADVVGWARHDDVGMLCVVNVRDGAVVGSRTETVRLTMTTSWSDTLLSCLMQYVLDPSHPTVPLLVVEGLSEDERKMLSEALTSAQGPTLGDNKAWMGACQVAVATAQTALATMLHDRLRQLTNLQDMMTLLGMTSPPQKMECFDISHTMGESTVASCVAAGPEGPLRHDYRRFNIKGVTPGDDYAAIAQAVRRRFSGSTTTAHPDVLFIDGGQGQVKAAMDALTEMQLKIMVVGVAKGPERKAGEERLIVGQTGEEIVPGAGRPGLLIIQALRDEAHRFAITGHRKQRDGRIKRSVLENIPGLGPTKRQQLLTLFGGWKGLQEASLQALRQTPGIGKVMAERIWAALHDHAVGGAGANTTSSSQVHEKS